MSSKNIVLGVTGSIAAYKAVELTNLLVKQGYLVDVIMTEAAQNFVAPLTFQTISHSPVHLSMFELPANWEIEHISLAQKADLILVAPASANFIGKLAAGLADDLLSATILASKATVLIAPAMNSGMYENPIFQSRMEFLKKHGYIFIEPEVGRLACGVEGKGHLASIEKIFDIVEQILSPKKDFDGFRILITAGPTREPIDPVRFISNYSSGKMGYAVAEAARKRGAQVILVSGPSNLKPPEGVDVIYVETAQEMLEAVTNVFQNVDAVIKAAAVADFRPKEISRGKLKKKSLPMILELGKTPDILEFIGKHKKHQVLVGFAAETDQVLLNAEKKLKQKNLDLIVANDLTEEGAGFGVDTNIATFIYPGGSIMKLPRMSKKELANKILDEVIKVLKDKRGE